LNKQLLCKKAAETQTRLQDLPLLPHSVFPPLGLCAALRLHFVFVFIVDLGSAVL